MGLRSKDPRSNPGSAVYSCVASGKLPSLSEPPVPWWWILNSWALLGGLKSTQYTRRAVAAGVLMLMIDNSTQRGGRELEAWELGREIAHLPALFAATANVLRICLSPLTSESPRRQSAVCLVSRANEHSYLFIQLCFLLLFFGFQACSNL